MRKKELLLSAAILALSTTGMAQSLTSSKALQNASANDGNTTAKAQAPKKAESTTDATAIGSTLSAITMKTGSSH